MGTFHYTNSILSIMSQHQSEKAKNIGKTRPYPGIKEYEKLVTEIKREKNHRNNNTNKGEKNGSSEKM